MQTGIQESIWRAAVWFGGVVCAASLLTMAGTCAQAAQPHRVTGKIYFQQVQIAYIGSGAAGRGRLTFRGRTYPFTIAGLGVGGIGLSKLTATGNVYDLNSLPDFEGVYGQARLGWAVANKGGGNLWLSNNKGVTLKLKTKRQGLMLAGGADGVKISFSH